MGFTVLMIRTLIIAVCLCFPAFGQTRGRPVDTSICSIAAHPSKFSNRNVRIRAMAVSSMEASFLMDSKDGEWNKDCGQINLDFNSAENDESTRRFLQLFAEQVSPPKCNQDEERLQGMAHILDPSVPAPTPCFNFILRSLSSIQHCCNIHWKATILRNGAGACPLWPHGDVRPAT